MGSPDPWLSQQFIKKSTESVTTFRKKHFVHIYLTYLQCKINYRLQRNPVIFLANQNILKALVVSEGHVSQLSLLTFRSSSLLCVCVNFTCQKASIYLNTIRKAHCNLHAPCNYFPRQKVRGPTAMLILSGGLSRPDPRICRMLSSQSHPEATGLHEPESGGRRKFCAAETAASDSA